MAPGLVGQTIERARDIDPMQPPWRRSAKACLVICGYRPVTTFGRTTVPMAYDSACWDYFSSQLEWMKRLANDPREPWTSKGLLVRSLEAGDLSLEPDLART